jgi:transcriptional regulator GlxA family with amidase domain
MHGIVFVVYPDFELLDVSGPTSVFNGANRALAQRNREPLYKISLVSVGGGPVASSSGIAVESLAITALRQEEATTVLVAGAEREPLLAAVSDAILRKAIPSLAASADRFGSVCTGGFLLASLGLLDRREVATH